MIEVMVSLIIAILIISMLPVSIEAAARINAGVKDMKTFCGKSSPEENTAFIAGIYDSSDEARRLEELSGKVSGYTEDGFYYYSPLPG